jgi:hypothetical protein
VLKSIYFKKGKKMKKYILMAGVAMMSLGNTSESWAECANGTYACGSSCIANGQDCYIYNDDGKVSELILNNQRKMIFNYDSGVNVSVYSYSGAGWDTEDTSYVVSTLEDGNNMISSTNIYNEYQALILDNKGRVIQSGEIHNGGWRNKTTYAYDEETGAKTSRTLYNCVYGGNDGQGGYIFNCTESATQDYTSDTDGNVIKEYINGELVAVNNYSDAYMAKLKSCPADKFSVGGECLPKRYTPAELAKVVGESNTILLYYK